MLTHQSGDLQHPLACIRLREGLPDCSFALDSNDGCFDVNGARFEVDGRPEQRRGLADVQAGGRE